MFNTNQIVTDNNFIKLNNILNKFNIFEATDMKKREIKHTKFLAYLLDPNESHGLGDSFLFIFLTTLIRKTKDIDVNLLSLHTELSQITPEWGSKAKNSTADKSSIDIYIKIPLHGTKSGFIHIFIENKLNSKQTDSQLETYSKLIAKIINNTDAGANDKIIKLFLTEQGEISFDKTWVDITYSETVIPAITEILETKNLIFSEYIKQVLIDYKYLLDDGDGLENEIEEIVEKISPDIIRKLQDNTSNDTEEQWERNNLRIRYAKAFNFLSEYDTDLRKILLNEWNGKTVASKTIRIDGKEYIFNKENSNRTCLRFTILTRENIKYIQDLARNSTPKWLDSYRHVAFEIGIRTIVDDNKEIINDQFLTWFSLILGPTDSNKAEARESLVRALLSGDPSWSNDLKTVTSTYTRIMSKKSIIKTQFRSLKKLKDEISERLFDYDKVQDSKVDLIQLKDQFSKIVVDLNNSLEKYFNSLTINEI